MTLTLLLDLDDTLLVNDMDTFLPRYLSLFSRQMAELISPDLFVKALLLGTRAMSENRRPDRTLRESFEQEFFARVEANPDQFFQIANKFYAESFVLLRETTQPVEGAASVVRQAFQRGFRVAIATNPLFPMSAIEQRLTWANTNRDEFPFDLVPSYENFHFSKPETAYFAEILANLGWPDGPVVMVGDDLMRDIAPANSLGLSTYWVGEKDKQNPSSGIQPTMAGPLTEIYNWLDGMPDASLTPSYNTPASINAVLRSTPAVMDSLSRDLAEEVWLHKPEQDEWCLTELICHLRDVEKEVNLSRLHKVLSEENPFIAGRDTDRWANERHYSSQDGNRALQDFTLARVQLLDILENLSENEWLKPARHAIFGPTPLVEIARISAAHDRLHVQQIQKTLRNLQAL